MKNDERIRRVHERAHQLCHRRDGTRLWLHGGACTALAAVLVYLLGGTGAAVNTDTLFTGASLLDAEVGGYVITAIAAFMTGTFITAVLIKHERKLKASKNEKKEK